MGSLRAFFREWMRQSFVAHPFCTFVFVVIPIILIVFYLLGDKR